MGRIIPLFIFYKRFMFKFITNFVKNIHDCNLICSKYNFQFRFVKKKMFNRTSLKNRCSFATIYHYIQYAN